MNRNIEIKDQVKAMYRLDPGRHEISFFVNGQEFFAKFKWPGKSKALLVMFHGAVDRATREIPVFPPILAGLGSSVAQLSISDPSMLLDGEFTLSWYAGSQDFRSQEVLFELFKEIILQGGYERTIFFGSSSGGFAALYYSSLIPKSIVVALVPQTNILSYYKGRVTSYRNSCWPNLESDNQLAKEIHVDLCAWYETLRPNTVVYLQSAGDHFHTRNHLGPFLNSIAKVKDAKFIIHSGFWGVLGHSGSVPADAYMPWLRSCLMCPTTEVDDLLRTYRVLTHEYSQLDRSVLTASTKNVHSLAEQLQMAELLCNYHLSQESDF